METVNFLEDKSRCDRCGSKMGSYQKSYFTQEDICNKCFDYEEGYIRNMKKRGMDPKEYKGCGYFPELK